MFIPHRMAVLLRALLAGAVLASGARAQFVERGAKFAGSGASPLEAARQASSVALSADGTTAIEGGPQDSRGRGAVWVFSRAGKNWTQQGEKLTANDGVGATIFEGRAVALSADGNTALIGGDGDSDGTGAAWIFTRADGVWTQEAKLTGSGAAGKSGQGSAVALSADGNTALVGGRSDDNGVAAAWVFTRSHGGWTQQGAKLVATGAVEAAAQGSAVALSADGNTALVGGPAAAWIFTRAGDVWAEQGAQLAGNLASSGVRPNSGIDGSRWGGPQPAVQGANAVALSADGDTAIIGTYGDQENAGAVWILSRSGASWTAPQKLAGASGQQLGYSVAISGDGARLLAGAPNADGGAGAAWEYHRVDGAWIPMGKLAGRGAAGKARQGSAVAISTDGGTALAGGNLDGMGSGAVWSFADPLLSIAAPSLVTAGAPVNFIVTAVDDDGNPVAGYRGTVHFNSTDGQADLPADARLTGGSGSFTITLKTSGAQKIVAADVEIPATAVTSDTIHVSAAAPARLLVEAPESVETGRDIPVSIAALDQFGNPADYRGSVHLSSTDPHAALPLDIPIAPGTSPPTLVRFGTPGKQTLTAWSSSLRGSAVIGLVQAQQATDYISTLLSTNPIAYFRLEAASDTSQVGGYTSTFTGGATLSTPGAPICESNNHDVALDGSTGYVTTSLVGGITTAATIVAWVNLAALPSTTGHILYVAGESQGQNDFDLQFTTDNYIRFYFDTGASVAYAPSALVLVGQWHMIAATFDAGTNTENMFWDGQLVASANSAPNPNKTTQFTIGESTVYTGRYFDGQIDEVAVWNTALTATQVSAIYSSACNILTASDSESIQVTDYVTAIPTNGNGQSTDYISTLLLMGPLAYFRLEAANDTSLIGGYTSTFEGAATLANGGAPLGEQNNHSAVLDGSTGYVATSLTGGITTAATTVAWVNLSALPSTAGHVLYVAGESQGQNDFDLQFTTDNYIRFYFDTGANVGYAPSTASLLNVWHMIAATFDAGTNTEVLYWDGQPVATMNVAPVTNKTTAFTIGASSYFAGRNFEGAIDEVALWNFALTAGQVAALYAAADPMVAVTDAESVSVADSLTLALYPPPPTVTLTSSHLPAGIQEMLTLTASVSGGNGTPTGTVTFYDGTAAIGSGTIQNGTVTIVIWTLSAGSHSLTAVYSGDANFAGATSPVFTQVVSGPGPCDINKDGVVDIRDVSLIVSQALGTAPATVLPMVNGVIVQIVINAVLGLGCAL